MQSWWKKLKQRNKLLTIGILSLWLIGVLFILCGKVEIAHDETHGWMIGSFVPIGQLFILTRWEGHFFLWFLLIRFISKIGTFPYALYFLNGFICFLVALLIWCKASFPRIIRLFALFSFPLFMGYPTYARPYGLATLCLLLLAHYFPMRLQRPLWYVFLLFIGAHTQLVGTIGAGAFGLVFAYDLIRAYQRREIAASVFWKTVGFGLFTIICLLAQTVGFQRPFYAPPSAIPWKRMILRTPLMAYLGCFLFLLKSKRAVFFLLFSFINLFLVYRLVYRLELWHWLFLFVYVVAAMWIFWQEHPKEKLSVYLAILFFMAAMWGYSYRYQWPLLREDPFKNMVQTHWVMLQNAQVFTLENNGLDMLPYLYAKGIKTYNLKTGEKDYSFDSLKKLYAEDTRVSYDKIVPLLTDDKPNVLLSDEGSVSYVRWQMRNSKKLHFSLYECSKIDSRVCIYFITR